ncbi:MAG TPA: hypothetical protein VKP00_09745, partial [Gemmatimonadaceae bacterium]|nr:hypothetical protein [Gemmatimonadaceae bacterium]
IMPGTTIGDGSVIGANSLVSGAIPPNSLAVGSPAKVIRSAPDFPRALSEDQRRTLVNEMVSEFDRYVEYNEFRIERSDVITTYRNGKQAHRLVRATEQWVVGDTLRRGDTVLSELPLSDDVQRDLNAKGVYWLDVAGKTRSASGSPLTEELAAFLGRYGIRLRRV